jgi:hypothetical protein
MFKRMLGTILAVVFVVVALAFAPTVATAFVNSRPTINEATANQPFTEQSCAAFEAWLLDPACSNAHVKKVARTKRHLARNAR